MQPRFVPPPPLTRFDRPAVFIGTSNSTILTEVPGILRMKVDSTGRLVAAGMVTSTGFSALDSSLLAMAWSADSARKLPTPPGSSAATVEYRFTADRTELFAGVALGYVEFGFWALDRLPVLVSPGPINFPPSLHGKGIGGRVTLAFVVGVDGQVIPATVRVVAAPHPDLAKAATTTIRAARFEPGIARGCAVPSVVQQSINFRPSERPIPPPDLPPPGYPSRN
jgi:TonB family protein